MDRSDIDSFLAVVECGTFSAAADKLYMSRSSITWHIDKIEEELKCRLFDRSKGAKKVCLTKMGETFLPYAVNISENYKAAEKALLSADSKKTLCISLGHFFNSLFAPVYKKYSELYPDISMKLHLRHSLEACELLKSDEEMDAVFTALYIEDPLLRVEPMFQEKMVLVCGTCCVFAADDTVRFDRLKVEDEIRWWMNYGSLYEWQREHFSQKNQLVIMDDFYGLQNLLDGSRLWSVVPLSMANAFTASVSGILVKDANFSLPTRTIYRVSRSDYANTPEFSKFLELCFDSLKGYGTFLFSP